jgi:hypothetical protein
MQNVEMKGIEKKKDMADGQRVDKEWEVERR